MGEVKREVSQKEVKQGEVMRIRVQVNVNLPLCRGGVFTRKNGVKGWTLSNTNASLMCVTSVAV